MSNRNQIFLDSQSHKANVKPGFFTTNTAANIQEINEAGCP